jgi:hypothetical protein
MRQRGIPSASGRQQFSGFLLHVLFAGWFSASQQLFEVLHEPLDSLQTSPGSRHEPPPLPQRPYASVGLVLKQYSAVPAFGSGEPDQPQQSLSTWQSSPTGWQPDGFWHTLNADDVPSPHAREQHDCSHGVPGVHVVPSTVPATRQLPMPEIVTSWHVPFGFPPDFTHRPLQHSLSVRHVSSSCLQNETADEHVPPTHASEQQSAFEPHGSPDPRHVVVRRWHLPPEQSPLQHCALLEHEPAVG